MSEESVEAVREAFEAYSRGDLEGMLDHLGPEFEFHPSGRWMDTQPVYRGHEGWIDFWNTFNSAWESITVSIERIEDLGDRVLVLGHFHGRGRESGVETSIDSAWLVAVKDGLADRVHAFASWGEALEAAGLSE